MRKYDKEWLQELCATSYSYAEVLTKAGRKQGGGTQATLRKKIEEFQIDISHFTGQRWYDAPNKECNFKGQSKEKYSLDEVFRKNSPVTQKVMRGYMERHKIIEYKCAKCGCDGYWQGETLNLQIHHKDGDNTNNEIENLCYLCPNCHSQTETYCRRKDSLIENE